MESTEWLNTDEEHEGIVQPTEQPHGARQLQGGCQTRLER